MRLLTNRVRDIEHAIREAKDEPLRLKGYATANLPDPASWPRGLVYDDTDDVVKVSDGSSWAEAGAGGASGRLIGRQIITATGAGTYTPTAGTAAIEIELIGAGGGGGGVASAGASNVNIAESGGGGAYLRKRLTANFSGASYSVGAKGTGGAAGANPGTAGGNTTFTDTAGSPTTYTAGGGAAGTTGTAGAPPRLGTSKDGGTATGGDLNIDGGASGWGVTPATGLAVGGNGGTSLYSPGGKPAKNASANTSDAGKNAPGKGGGGSGAVSDRTGPAAAGGNGSDGMIIIWEYS